MAITKTGGLLIKEAVARWKDFIQNMSKANRSRIINEGVAKSEEAYINGMNRGTINIVNRHGYTRGNIDGLTPEQASKAKATTQAQYAKAQMQNDQGAMDRNALALANQRTGYYFGPNPLCNPKRPAIWTGASTLGYGKTIHTKGMQLPNSVITDEGKRFLNAVLNRHEAYEAISAEKAMQRYFKDPAKGDRRAIARLKASNPALKGLSDQQILSYFPDLETRAIYGIKTPGRFSSSSGSPAGSHLSMDVLGKERKLLDTFAYKENDGYKHFRNSVRRREYNYMDRAGEYKPGTFERYNRNNFKRMASKIKPGVPVRLRRNETWTPLY